MNSGVVEMGFIFCDLHVSLNNVSSEEMNSTNASCFYISWLSPAKYKEDKIIIIKKSTQPPLLLVDFSFN